MFYKYNGTALAIKLPTNATGEPVGASGTVASLQCFLIWSSLPVSGDIIIDLDVVEYPYALQWILSQSLPDSTPMWEDVAGPATVGSPVLHQPVLPNAIF